jgi:cellulose synthase/poly-beta-1,6-N-acetylglucosamine synthase-like glycosyltransferase
MIKSSQKTPKITVVIPAFNEEELIADCLEAVLAQTLQPYEIIVVDNNSTDNTAEIASSYAGVTVITENHQGIFFARNAGFNVATGDIIARTDADSLPAPDWLQTVLEYLVDNNSAAVTGRLQFSDVFGLGLLTKAEAIVRRNLINSTNLPKFLSGANMAIRRDAWQDIWSKTCPMLDIHEDVDLTIHLQRHGLRVGFEPKMVVSTSARRMGSSFKEYYSYVKKIETTYNQHDISGLKIKLPILLYVPFQPLIKIARKAYLLKKYRTVLYRLIADQVSAQ